MINRFCMGENVMLYKLGRVKRNIVTKIIPNKNLYYYI